jgi:O-antigen ligase
VAVLAFAALVGIGTAYDVLVSGAIAAVGLAGMTLHTRAWLLLTSVVLAGLILLSWGFNNIAVPLGGAVVPLVDVILVYALVASLPLWFWIASSSPLGRRIAWLLGCVTAVAAVRLFVDIPKYGLLAGRDALYVLEAWAVMVGLAAGRIVGEERLCRWFGWLWRVAILISLLFPLRDALAELGPIVGVQRPTPLIQFTNAGFVATFALFWFLQERRRSSLLFAALSVVVLFMVQSRGAILAVVLTALVGSIVHLTSSSRLTRAWPRHQIVRRAAIALAFALIALVLLPPIAGRLGEPVGPQSIIAQLGTLTGADGPGDGSLRHRSEAWPKVAQQVFEVPGGWLLGVGYGPDLFFGFEVDGADVRKPHNDVLEIWARTGLIGLLPWLALLASLGIWALRIAPRLSYGWWLIALQMAMLMAALTQPAFAFAYRGLVYMLLMGLVLGAHAKSKPHVQEKASGKMLAHRPQHA